MAMSLLVLGSIALDTIKTPFEEHAEILGGAASYAAVSASFFTTPQLVGIVGDDFPKEHVDFFQKRNIDLAGLQVVPGKTFRWSGEYFFDMNSRETRSTELNVFEHFSPELPAAYRKADIILLGNIAPDLQLHVLDQLEAPKFIVADTMNLWINIARPRLMDLLGRIDMLLLNDSEAREITGETSLIKAGRRLREMGPAYVAIKKGEHGCLLFGEGEFFSCPAFPLEDIHDPTGAGDAFAGGLAGYLAQKGSASQGAQMDFKHLCQAVVYGSVMASFSVESFSIERLKKVEESEIEERFQAFQRLSAF